MRLIVMWCGTGKTRTFTYSILEDAELVNVMVFPSLVLIEQYVRDYILTGVFKDLWTSYRIICFCSSKFIPRKIDCHTDTEELGRFLKQAGKRLVLVTYNSLGKFVDVVKKNRVRIHRLIYDEAHHSVSKEWKKIIYGDKVFDQLVDKTEFYTATPRNDNGILMFSRDEDIEADCGPLFFNYTYTVAVEEGRSKRVLLCVNICSKYESPKGKTERILETIARLCLQHIQLYKFFNILLFHVKVNGEKDSTCVKEFIKNEEQLRNIFERLQEEDAYRHTKPLLNKKNIHLKGIYSDGMKKEERGRILAELDETSHGRVNVVSSCRTIGEGADTKHVNCVLLVDGCKSHNDTSQKFGRCVRVNGSDDLPSLIGLPYFLDMAEFKKKKTKKEQSEYIVENMFNDEKVLKHFAMFECMHDPEILDAIARYPSRFSPNEIIKNLKKYGLIVLGNEGSARASIHRASSRTTELEIGDADDNDLNAIAQEMGITLEVHTQNMDEPIQRINAGCEETVRVFQNSEGNVMPIVEEHAGSLHRNVEPPQRHNFLDECMFTDPGIELEWTLQDFQTYKRNFHTGILKYVIKKTQKEKDWDKNFEALCGTIDEKKMLPDPKTDLGIWFAEQIEHYAMQTGPMKSNKTIYRTDDSNNSPIYNRFAYFLKEYHPYLKDFVDGSVHMVFKNGNQYTGRYKEYKRHGEGKMEYGNGNVFEGEWENGKPKHGTMTYRNGDEYSGPWKENKREGLNGLFKTRHGDVYQGEWSGDKKNGHGTQNYRNGNQYEGEWKDDKRHGQGTLTLANGNQYKGDWQDNKRNGQGTYAREWSWNLYVF